MKFTILLLLALSLSCSRDLSPNTCNPLVEDCPRNTTVACSTQSLDLNYTIVDATLARTGATGDEAGQNFLVESNGELKKIELYLSAAVDNTTVALEIRSGGTTPINGTLLGSTSATVSTTSGWYTFTFTDPIDVYNDGTLYFIRISSSATFTVHYDDGPSTYPGFLRHKTGAGAWTGSVTADIAIKTYHCD